VGPACKLAAGRDGVTRLRSSLACAVSARRGRHGSVPFCSPGRSRNGLELATIFLHTNSQRFVVANLIYLLLFSSLVYKDYQQVLFVCVASTGRNNKKSSKRKQINF
jgi:hypothetical protein